LAARHAELKQRLPSFPHHGLDGLNVGEVRHMGWLETGEESYENQCCQVPKVCLINLKSCHIKKPKAFLESDGKP
jgi:hypothetical protein